MRTLQSAAKAVLFPLLVLAFSVPSATFALSIPGGLVSGVSTIQPLSLEGDSAALSSSPDSEVADSNFSSAVAPIAASGESLIAIRAVNPGYTLSADKNAGELVELINLSSDEVNLSNISLVYIAKPTDANPMGKETVLYTFPSGAVFAGRSILFRYVDSPEAADGAQDLTYDATSIAMAGSLKLVQNYIVATTSTEMSASVTDSATILSSVCWLGGSDCLPVFSTTVKTRSYTTILRDDETGEYAHTNDYVSLYDAENPGLYLPSPESESPDITSANNSTGGASSINSDIAATAISTTVCTGLVFSEFLTYYDENSSEQFIEFYNSSNRSIPLEQCRMRYKNKTYMLSETPLLLNPDTYYVFHPPLTLTKNPTASNLYEILDQNDETIDKLELPHGQKKSASFAKTGKTLDGSDLWQITYAPSPGEPNIYQEFRTCPAGKIVNEATGNCINATTLSTIAKDCPAGKYRNPTTGRCKAYDSDESSEITPCKEGYERNPETNRCRKVKQNNGADYPLIPITDTKDSSSFIALGALLVVLGLGLLYVLFQFRRDIYYTLRRIINKFIKH